MLYVMNLLMKHFQNVAPGTVDKTLKERTVRYLSTKRKVRSHTFQIEKNYLMIMIPGVRKVVQ